MSLCSSRERARVWISNTTELNSHKTCMKIRGRACSELQLVVPHQPEDKTKRQDGHFPSDGPMSASSEGVRNYGDVLACRNAVLTPTLTGPRSRAEGRAAPVRGRRGRTQEWIIYVAEMSARCRRSRSSGWRGCCSHGK